MSTPVFRFAPSPNGRLHLGHAASALLNQKMATKAGGRMLLRIEDIDTTRCRPEFEQAIYDDLRWLGLAWEKPVLRQSERFGCYRAALDRLANRDLLYACFCTRSQLVEMTPGKGHDPDGTPIYSMRCRGMAKAAAALRISRGERFSLRLKMDDALACLTRPLSWQEESSGAARTVQADPGRWGDVILARKEFPASYHVAVVVDDADQGVTHVVRGRDLFESTAIHRLLQTLLGLPEPRYHHHALLRDEAGNKLSKSLGSISLAELRAQGVSPAEARLRATI